VRFIAGSIAIGFQPDVNPSAPFTPPNPPPQVSPRPSKPNTPEKKRDRQLLRGVMLRRSKASVAGQLALPPCTREDLRVALSVPERCVCFCVVLRSCLRRGGTAAVRARMPLLALPLLHPQNCVRSPIAQKQGVLRPAAQALQRAVQAHAGAGGLWLRRLPSACCRFRFQPLCAFCVVGWIQPVIASCTLEITTGEV
jgi:hypothetical protein